MTNFRDIKRKMRRDLHGVMQIPALYYATDASSPVPITIRDHTKFGAVVGAIPGGAAAATYAQMVEPQMKILFLVAEVPKPRVNAIVSVEAGEAYRVEAADPADDITILAKVSRIPANDPVLATLAVPT